VAFGRNQYLQVCGVQMSAGAKIHLGGGSLFKQPFEQTFSLIDTRYITEECVISFVFNGH
jgi:hypothetical protein